MELLIGIHQIVKDWKLQQDYNNLMKGNKIEGSGMEKMKHHGRFILRKITESPKKEEKLSLSQRRKAERSKFQ